MSFIWYSTVVASNFSHMPKTKTQHKDGDPSQESVLYPDYTYVKRMKFKRLDTKDENSPPSSSGAAISETQNYDAGNYIVTRHTSQELGNHIIWPELGDPWQTPPLLTPVAASCTLDTTSVPDALQRGRARYRHTSISQHARHQASDSRHSTLEDRELRGTHRAGSVTFGNKATRRWYGRDTRHPQGQLYANPCAVERYSSTGRSPSAYVAPRGRVGRSGTYNDRFQGSTDNNGRQSRVGNPPPNSARYISIPVGKRELRSPGKRSNLARPLKACGGPCDAEPKQFDDQPNATAESAQQATDAINLPAYSNKYECLMADGLCCIEGCPRARFTLETAEDRRAHMDANFLVPRWYCPECDKLFVTQGEHWSNEGHPTPCELKGSKPKDSLGPEFWLDYPHADKLALPEDKNDPIYPKLKKILQNRPQEEGV